MVRLEVVQLMSCNEFDLTEHRSHQEWTGQIEMGFLVVLVLDFGHTR